MSLNIKDSEADRLVRALAAQTGESITQAVTTAVRERLDRLQGSRVGQDLVTEIAGIARRCAALPIVDDRSDDEILGYDRDGIPA